MVRSKYSSQAGVTLVELIVALLIFATVFISGVACLRLGLNQIDNARSETRASQIMQSEIERLRSLAWDNLKALTAVDQDVTISTDYTGAKGYGSFSMKRTISGTGETRKIVLVITWTDLSGAAHSKSYVTQYTKGGLYDYIQ